MKASASRHELPLLAYDVVIHLLDDPSLILVHRLLLGGFLLGGLVLLVLLLGGEDSETLASVTEHGDTLASGLPCVHVDVVDVGLGEVLGQVDGGGDRRIDVVLPGGLHVDPLPVVQVLSGDEEVGEVLVLPDLRVLVDVGLDDGGVDLVVIVMIREGCCPPLVGDGEDGLDTS